MDKIEKVVQLGRIPVGATVEAHGPHGIKATHQDGTVQTFEIGTEYGFILARTTIKTPIKA